jgi:hypothetical protein
MNLNRPIIVSLLTFLFLVPAASSESMKSERSLQQVALYQKPGANVRLMQNRLSVAEPGQVISFPLGINTGHRSGKMQITFLSAESIEILGIESTHEISLDGSVHYEIPVDIVAKSSGTHYLPIQFIIDDDGHISHRALSIAIDVGGVQFIQSKTPDLVRTIPDGRFIKPMSADEEIR